MYCAFYSILFRGAVFFRTRCILYMRAFGASTSDVILVKSQSSKTSHSKTSTRIDYPYGQTLLALSVTKVTTCVIFLLT